MMDKLALLCSNGKEHPHRLHSRHRREHLIEVNAGLLDIPLRHQARFMFDDGPQFIALDLEHSLEPDGTVPTWEIDEYPGVILLDG